MVKCGARLCRSARGVSACTPSSTMRVSRCYHRRMRIAPRTPNHANATASKNASCGVLFCPRQLTVSRFVACSYREHLQQQDCHGHVQQEHSLCDQHVCRAVWHWRRHQSGPEDLVAGYSQQSWAAAVSKQRASSPTGARLQTIGGIIAAGSCDRGVASCGMHVGRVPIHSYSTHAGRLRHHTAQANQPGAGGSAGGWPAAWQPAARLNRGAFLQGLLVLVAAAITTGCSCSYYYG